MGCDNWYDSWDCAIKSTQNNINNASKSIDNVFGTNFSGNGGGFLSGGDVAKQLGLQFDNVKKIASAPIDVTLDLAKGDTKSAGVRLVKAGAGFVNFAVPAADLWASNGGQKFLRNNLGLNNFAGFNAGIVQARDTGTMSNQYRDESIRFGAEAAVIGGGIYAYNNPVIPTFGEAGYVSGSEIVSGVSNPFTTNGLLGASAIKNLTSSNNPLKEITKELLGKDIADIVFPNPTQTQPSNSQDSTEFSPWKTTSPTSNVTSSQGTSSNMNTYLMIGAGIIVTALLIKRFT